MGGTSLLVMVLILVAFPRATRNVMPSRETRVVERNGVFLKFFFSDDFSRLNFAYVYRNGECILELTWNNTQNKLVLTHIAVGYDYWGTKGNELLLEMKEAATGLSESDEFSVEDSNIPERRSCHVKAEEESHGGEESHGDGYRGATPATTKGTDRGDTWNIAIVFIGILTLVMVVILSPTTSTWQLISCFRKCRWKRNHTEVDVEAQTEEECRWKRNHTEMDVEAQTEAEKEENSADKKDEGNDGAKSRHLLDNFKRRMKPKPPQTEGDVENPTCRQPDEGDDFQGLHNQSESPAPPRQHQGAPVEVEESTV